jgi:hypothetical protein
MKKMCRYFHPSRYQEGGTEEEIWDMGENITCRVAEDLAVHVEAELALPLGLSAVH